MNFAQTPTPPSGQLVSPFKPAVLPAAKPQFGGQLGRVSRIILQDLHEHGPSTRAQIDKRTGEVKNLTRLNTLRDGGYIRKTGEAPGSLFQISNKGRAIIGVPPVDESKPARDIRICNLSMRAVFDPSRDLHGGRIGLAMCGVSKRQTEAL